MPTPDYNPDENSKYIFKAKKDYQEDWNLHRNYIQDFDAWEAMLLGQVYDTVSKSVDGSKITDSYAMTLAKERADRVVAKLPDGETQSAGKADVGKAAFMDILRQKWIYPNANAQRPFLEKLNLWQLYSSVYGYMPMFYDWTTSNTGYVGPDCWLWNPRNLIPQQGKVSIEDSDYITALTWVNQKKLQDIIDNEVEGDGWNRDALRELVTRVNNGITGNDSEKDTFVERQRNPQGARKGICLATRYESGPNGEWCTFCPDDGYIEIRRLKNPHKNGKIPFVIKYSQPLFDSFYGLGQFQRKKALQFARDGLTNFYFANLKRNLAPGIIVNANGVVKHTLDVTRANPVLMETIPNSIRPMPTNTAGLSTYQGAQSALTGAMLAQDGSQNAAIPGAESLNPSQGKTPAAIDLYSSKEATQDGAELRHLETGIEQLTDGFNSLIVNIGTEDIPISLFSEDIQDIVDSGLSDVVGLFKGRKFKPDATMTAGQLTIDPKALKGVEYRFNITPDSTMKVNKQQQLQSVTNLLGDLGKFQNIYKDDPRVDVNFGEILQRIGELSDIKGADKFITVKDGPSPQEQQMQQKMQELQTQQQSQTQVTSPSGQVHESADLTKLYLGTDDQGLKQQIIEAMGFQPSPPQPQSISNEGGVYIDPHVAEAAKVIATHEPSTPEPTINQTGMYQDPHLAEAASQIDKLAPTKAPTKAKESNAVAK